MKDEALAQRKFNALRRIRINADLRVPVYPPVALGKKFRTCRRFVFCLLYDNNCAGGEPTAICKLRHRRGGKVLPVRRIEKCERERIAGACGLWSKRKGGAPMNARAAEKRQGFNVIADGAAGACIGLHKKTPAAAAGHGLKTEGAGAGEKINDPRVLEVEIVPRCKDVEKGFPGAVRRGTGDCTLRRNDPPAAKFSAYNTHVI